MTCKLNQQFLVNNNSVSQDLEDWLSGAGDAGVIYFSLGTVVKISGLPDK